MCLFYEVLNSTTNTKYSEIWWEKSLQNTFAENNHQILILEKKTRTSHRRFLMENQKSLVYEPPMVRSSLF